MELDSWRLVSSIPRDWSNSGFPAAFLFERTQIVFWTFFHSWRNEEPYHLPPVEPLRRTYPLSTPFAPPLTPLTSLYSAHLSIDDALHYSLSYLGTVDSLAGGIT